MKGAGRRNRTQLAVRSVVEHAGEEANPVTTLVEDEAVVKNRAQPVVRTEDNYTRDEMGMDPTPGGNGAVVGVDDRTRFAKRTVGDRFR